jgi:hypothetical protein
MSWDTPQRFASLTAAVRRKSNPTPPHQAHEEQFLPPPPRFHEPRVVCRAVRPVFFSPTMLAHYHGRDWQKCLETILRCRELGREAGLEEFYNHYVERVRRLIDAPPEPGWDGVWVAERK